MVQGTRHLSRTEYPWRRSVHPGHLRAYRGHDMVLPRDQCSSNSTQTLVADIALGKGRPLPWATVLERPPGSYSVDGPVSDVERKTWANPCSRLYVC